MPIMRQQPERLVFIDETSVKTNLTRLRGRALRGERLEMDAPFGNWGTQTFIAGLTRDALIAPWVIKGAMDGPAFAAYVREVLVPELAPGSGCSGSAHARWAVLTPKCPALPLWTTPQLINHARQTRSRRCQTVLSSSGR